MNAIKLSIATLAGLLTWVGSAFAIDPPVGLPIDDGGLLVVAVAGLAVAIAIARWKRKL